MKIEIGESTLNMPTSYTNCNLKIVQRTYLNFTMVNADTAK
jgi:hypothetical protein